MQQHLKSDCPIKSFLALAILCLGLLFVMIGCGQLYEKMGLSPDQAEAQVAADQQATSAILDQARTSTAEIITTILAGLGATASGILAKWLGTEKKITRALITGIEQSKGIDVKDTVKKIATTAGIEDALHKRVIALT